MRTTFVVVAALALFGCGRHHRGEPDVRGGEACQCVPELKVPSSGEVTLAPHTTDSNYLGSVVSFEWAATTDSAEVNNDWDLSLEPNTAGGPLVFRVNTVTDDRSCLQDLGPIELVNVPEQISECGDLLPAIEGHLYLVHTVDSDTDQYAAFGVTRASAASVTLRWFRSGADGKFVLDL